MPASLETSPEALAPEPRPVVLVVDDYAENRRLLEFFLRDRYEVNTDKLKRVPQHPGQVGKLGFEVPNRN